MKNLKTSLYVLTGLIIMIAYSCKKETSQTTLKTPPIVSPYSYDKGNTTNASFLGSILDENQQVVADAKITIGGKTAMTNKDGVFFIENASVFEDHAYIKAEKNGFFLGSRSIVPTSGVNKIEITLLQKKVIGSFDASTGGRVSGDGITIDFQGGIVDAYGNPYSGNVSVAAKYIDPESTEINSIMPGNLIGANANGSSALKSLGMVAVQITDVMGNELQLAKGSPAEVTFPLSPSLKADAPNTIPLWYFDEVNGFWSEEGSATLVGNTYKAKVTHFSFWNCDIRVPSTNIKGRIVDNNGDGVAGVRIKIISPNAGAREAISDNDGYYGGRIPSNQNLILEIIQKCGSNYQSIYTKNIGSFSSKTTISDINIGLGSPITITGNLVDCNQNPVTNGYLIDQDKNIIQLKSGKFSFISCSNKTITLRGIDIKNTTESKTKTISVGTSSMNIGNIQACQSLNNYIKWTINGTDYIATTSMYLIEDSTSTQAYLSGYEPNQLNANFDVFNGVGTYVINASTSRSDPYFYAQGVYGQWDSGKVTINITKYGSNPGDRIEGNFNGQVSGKDSIGGTPSVRKTSIINGTLQFDQR